ncbi:hypothetical protein BY996DRAFT_8545362 [Phakopsora pachyrhizi]|nr:hypothetical protein BY996DRAFT_8545362 [Phakopsora pachyrhizi]
MDGWEPAGEDLRSGIWPAKTKSAKLWITGSKSITNHTELEPINKIDVIWGNIKINKPWWGFERIIGGPVFGSDNKMDHTRLQILVGGTRECGTVCQRNMLLATKDVPLNILLTGKGNGLQQAGLKDQILSGVGGLKLHETPLKFINRIGAVHPNLLILAYQSKSKDLSLSFKVLLPVGNLLAYLPKTVFKNCLPILSCISKTAPSDSSSLKSIGLGTMSLSNSKRFSE